jgi:pyrroline-5-carboxylate reductase
MQFGDIAARGIVILGCGKMGGALLAGWLGRGLPPASVWVTDPAPSDWLAGTGVHLNQGMPVAPALALIAVKPQMMGAALPGIAALGGGGTLILTVAAGTPIATYEQVFGPGTPVIRTMPNTPAAIGRGITALIGNRAATAGQMALAEGLMGAVGQTVRLDSEAQMDAVTALSGSGPAYVFHLIETMAAAGVTEGLSPDLSLRLARATVAGAGALAENDDDPGQLRRNVTSPNGTTQAALEVLMDEAAGFPALLKAAVHRARIRSEDLSRG